MGFECIEAAIVAFFLFLYGTLLIFKVSKDPILLGKTMFVSCILFSLCSFGIYYLVNSSG